MAIELFEDIPGLASYYLARSLIDDGLVQGNLVSTWRDLESGRDFGLGIQPEVPRPHLDEAVVNQRPGIDFGNGHGLDSGSLNSYLNGRLAGAGFTLYVAALQRSSGSDMLLAQRDGGGFNGWRVLFSSGGNLGVFSTGGISIFGRNVTEDADILALRWEPGVRARLYDRGGFIGEDTTGTLGTSYSNTHLGHRWGPSGPGDWLDGHIFGLVVAGAIHTDQEVQEVCDLLYGSTVASLGDGNVTQHFLEYSEAEQPEGRVSGLTVEVQSLPPTDGRITEHALEVASAPPTQTCLTQNFIEIAIDEGSCVTIPGSGGPSEEEICDVDDVVAPMPSASDCPPVAATLADCATKIPTAVDCAPVVESALDCPVPVATLEDVAPVCVPVGDPGTIIPPQEICNITGGITQHFLEFAYAATS